MTQAVMPMTITLDAQVAPVAALICALLLNLNVCWPVVGAGLEEVPPVGAIVVVCVGISVQNVVGELDGVSVGEDVGLAERGRGGTRRRLPGALR